jgi:ribosomal-protein-alanine N-acetyltransferase
LSTPAGRAIQRQVKSVIHPTPPEEINKLGFRLMTLEDIPQVLKIDQLSFSLPWPEKSYQFELTRNPSTLAIVAEISLNNSTRFVIGMSVVWIIIDEAHIATIAIHPDFRGHGYGKRLLAETLVRSTQRGAHTATLEVRDGNKVAQQMYQEFGFTMVGRRLHYYHDNNEDAIMMTVENLGTKDFTRLYVVE